MDKIVLVDFCGTIVNFQTYDPFVLYVLCREKPIKYYLLKSVSFTFAIKCIQKFLKRKNYLYKDILTFSLKHINYNHIKKYGKEYYMDIVKPNLILQTVDIIKKYQTEGYRVIIVTGACFDYVSMFTKDYGIEDLICVKLKVSDTGYCTGKIEDIDCIGDNKIKLIKQYMNNNNITGEFVLGVSDSSSDISMLSLCKRKIVLSKAKHQIWVTSDMEEIIWN